jgi:hypothetical protein
MSKESFVLWTWKITAEVGRMDCGLLSLALYFYKKIDCKRCGKHTQFAFKGSLGLCSYEINAQCRMDSQASGILGIFGFLMSMGGAVYAAINHKKIRCKCCGKNLDMSVDVDSTEPEKKDEPESQLQEESNSKDEIPTLRRASIHNDEDIEIERKHYRKTKVAPLPEEV